MKIREFERVVLLHDMPSEGLSAGDVGVAVDLLQGGKGVIVEFMTFDGDTIAVVTLHAEQVRPIGRKDMIHIRQLAGLS